MINYHARWVIPVTRPPFADGTVSVSGTRIVYVGPRRDAPAGEDAELGDAVLLPGLVNAHTHLELTAMRGLLTGLEFVSWIRTLTAARAAVLTPASMRDGACQGIAEGLLAGITTYADTCASGVVLGAMRDMGVRGIMYQELFGPAAEQRAESMAQLRRNVDALRPLETGLVRLGVSPHAPYTVHEDLLIDASAYAIGEGLPVAIHLAESDAEIAFLREAEGPFAEGFRARGIPVIRRSHSPVHLLVELGVVLARPLLIHCVKLEAVGRGLHRAVWMSGRALSGVQRSPRTWDRAGAGAARCRRRGGAWDPTRRPATTTWTCLGRRIWRACCRARVSGGRARWRRRRRWRWRRSAGPVRWDWRTGWDRSTWGRKRISRPFPWTRCGRRCSVPRRRRSPSPGPRRGW